MSPRRRKTLDPKSKDFSTRFALHLRGLLAVRELTTAEFVAKLNKAGVEVTGEAVKKWLQGAHFPKHRDFEVIGRVLGLKDYRQFLPPP